MSALDRAPQKEFLRHVCVLVVACALQVGEESRTGQRKKLNTGAFSREASAHPAGSCRAEMAVVYKFRQGHCTWAGHSMGTHPREGVT